MDEDALRAEVRAFIDATWDPAMLVRDWWARLNEAGFGFPAWSKEWFGRGYTTNQQDAVYDEMAKADVLGPPEGAGPGMAAPMLSRFGSDEQKRRWLPDIAHGKEYWAQFFSEPEAGSDLASLQTRAVRDGDQWLINGQKVWNSMTLLASKGLLVARTDASVPKHKGLGFFIIDLDQPQIDIRPIKQMNHREEFNEAFFTDAVVHDSARIGEPTQGWAVAMEILSHERSNFAAGGSSVLARVIGGEKAGFIDMPAGEAVRIARSMPTVANGLAIGTIPQVIDMAKAAGRAGDVVIRQRIAELHCFDEALRLTALRGAAKAKSGHGGDTEGSVAYLGGVRKVRMYRDLVAELAGPAGMLDGTEVADSILTSAAHGIQGGTEQIQRNVIGERLLGLPREPQVDRDIPFNELRKSGR